MFNTGSTPLIWHGTYSGAWAMALGTSYIPTAAATASTAAKHMAAPVNNAPTQAVRV